MESPISKNINTLDAVPVEHTNGASKSELTECLSTLLAERGLVSDRDLKRAGQLAQADGVDLSGLLIRLGMISERDMAATLSDMLHLRFIQECDYPGTAISDVEVSARFLKESHVIPIEFSDNQLHLAMADPLNSRVVDAIALACERQVLPCIGLASDIDKAIEALYGSGQSHMDQIVAETGHSDDLATDDVEHLRDLASEAPVIRLVNHIIQRAVSEAASDIHIEPMSDSFRVRIRIDGALRETEAPPHQLSAAIVSRVKIMAGLNIAERRLPQDGRMRIPVEGRNIDVRVSTAPTLHGESVVMRLLDRTSVPLDFGSQGFSEADQNILADLLSQPNGIILITGPTGSGKTTTLYTGIRDLNQVDRKIITIEDPVEYGLEGINQIQINPQLDLTFATALRSILRQDPDIIMVGEMRDMETAHIAVQAALTGHLVLSTLHTNSAAGGITRLLDMGIPDYLITATVNAIVAQRLVRKICPDCCTPLDVRPEITATLLAENGGVSKERQFYAGKGCDHCDHTGFKGRTVVNEMLILDDRMRAIIQSGGSTDELHKAAIETGMRTIRSDGLAKAAAGITTVDEVLRVTRED